MRKVLRHPGLRLIFAANMISMIGSGMNTSGVTWYVLQTTHSEAALGTLLMLQTIPAMLMLPFSGVVIDREDRRRLVMVLDAARAIVILLVAVLVLRGLAKLWDEHSGGRGILDVLANHECSHPGVEAGIGIHPGQQPADSGLAGRMAHCWIHGWFCLQLYRLERSAPH